jgi:hypothetical protein
MNADDWKPNDRLERALQASLRPVDPGADFTQALQARLATAVLPSREDRRERLPTLRRLYSTALPLAASLVVALAVGWQLQDLRAVQRAEQARVHTQLLLALEITGDQLGQAQQRIEQYQSQEKSL